MTDQANGPTIDDFRNARWHLIDPLIEEANARLPDHFEWICGGMCARLHYGNPGMSVSLCAWAQCHGQWSLTGELGRGHAQTGSFAEALDAATEIAIKHAGKANV